METKISVDIELLTIEQAAEVLGLTYGAVRYHVLQGHLRSIKLGPHATLLYASDVYRLKAEGTGKKKRQEQLTA